MYNSVSNKFFPQKKLLIKAIKFKTKSRREYFGMFETSDFFMYFLYLNFF